MKEYMLAEFYLGEHNGQVAVIRLFKSGSATSIADLRVAKPTRKSAEYALEQLGLVKKSRWSKTTRGWECWVQLPSPKGRGFKPVGVLMIDTCSACKEAANEGIISSENN